MLWRWNLPLCSKWHWTARNSCKIEASMNDYWNIRRKLFAYAIGLTSGWGWKSQSNDVKLVFILSRREMVVENWRKHKTTNHCRECNNIRLQIGGFKPNICTLVTHLKPSNFQPTFYGNEKNMIQTVQWWLVVEYNKTYWVSIPKTEQPNHSD